MAADEPFIPHTLHDVSTRELLEELTRRSLGFLAVQVSVAENNEDAWMFAFRGSVNMTLSMNSILQTEIVNRIAAARGQ